MFTIRAVQSDDVPFLWEMTWEAAVATSPEIRAGGRSLELAKAALHRSQETWRRAGPGMRRRSFEAWQRGGVIGVVAVDDDGRPLGAMWCHREGDGCRGDGFGVIPDARGQGIGEALFDALLATAREQGRRSYTLTVDRENPARRLYERHGFRDTGTSSPDDATVTMTLTF